MNEPIVFKRSVLIGQLVLIQLLVPPVVAFGTLFALTQLYGVEFDTGFQVLSVLVAILSPTVMKRPQVNALTVIPRWGSIAVSLIVRWLLLIAILIGIGYATKTSSEFSRRVVLTWAAVTPIPLIFVSIAFNELVRRFMLAPSNVRVAVIAGYNDVSIALAERVRADPGLGIRVEGSFDDRSPERLGLPEGRGLLGGLSDLAGYVNTHKVDLIFIALPMRQVQRVVDLLDDLRDTTASIYFVPDIFVMDLIQSRTAEISGIPVVAMCETPFQGTPGLVKRAMDVGLSVAGLLALAPFLLVVALLIKLSSPGPVIFRQRRYGLDGQIIDVYKFRTMRVIEDGPQVIQAKRDDPRVTPIGRFLRRYSIDELPQLFNVIGGSMSLVGPRPHAVAHNEEYRGLIKGYMVRHKVLPGITGLAQINGCRGETSKLEDMKARIEYDLEYLRQWTPSLDLKILFKTAIQVLGDRKAY
ncbi:MAG TPA: undecaprenyl-phosphate glucose phosphotransferase [Steroidobacteraceae bacterium]|jgi:putative colanic acid biosynthesis UDP-glucose lipid carrier transferase|nr:undecaprenyl-phosphate glucose phosphotransferase [Steroidobacteraceae bacterium]